MRVKVKTVLYVSWACLIVALCAELARPQTTINGQRIIVSDTTVQGATTLTGTTKTVNFEASLPGTCTAPSGSTPGEMVFRTSDNTLHACTATNTFTQIGGGGGGCQVTEDTFANQPGTCAECDTFHPTDNIGLFGYCPTTNTWKYRYYGARVTPPPSTGWSFVNQASATATTTNGAVTVTSPASGAVNVTAYCRSPATSINGDFRFLMDDDTSDQPPGVNAPTDFGVGIAFRESGTGKFVDFRLFCDASGCGVNNSKWNSATSFSAVYAGFQGGQHAVEWHTRNLKGFRLDLSDSTNIVFYWSADLGDTWQQFDTRTKTDFFTIAPDQICILHYTNGARIISRTVSYVGN